MATNFRTKLTTIRPLWKIIVPSMHLPLLSGSRYPTVSFKFFSCRPPLPWHRILGQNWL